MAEKTTTELIRQLKDDFDNVYEEGRQAYSREWWDKRTYNNSGTAIMSGSFNYVGYDSGSTKLSDYANWLFTPPYPVRGAQMSSMFAFAAITKDMTADMLDTSYSTNCYRMFQQCKIPRIEVMNFSKGGCKAEGFLRDAQCHTIDKIIFNAEGKTNLSDIFGSANNLKNVYEVTGLIAGGNLNISASKLTASSAVNFIKCLNDYTGTEEEGAYMITFSSTTLGYLDSGNGTVIDGKPWRNYISDLGWNIG